MTVFLRSLRALILPALILLPVPAMAQMCTIPADPAQDATQYDRPDDPWIYRGTDIPVDRNWLFGELPNGVRYAVRRNGAPPCQVSIRVAIDAGAINETESERGFAHLIEHLTFRQSRNFASGEAIGYFQRLGTSFGIDTNAQTSPTQTIYQIDLPGADRPKLGDVMLRVAGMVREPALSAENLAADLPIVLAERRERQGPDQRIAQATQEVLYAGQLLADRSPIGTVEALEAATPASVRAFHDRWYRPENTVVVLVGDADPQFLAALVEQTFADWQVAGPATPAPDFGDPQMPEGADPANPVGETAVVVEPGQARGVIYAVMRPWEEITDNLEYNRGLLIDAVAQAIINRRLEERARAGASYLFAQVQQQDVSRSADSTFVSFAPLTADWETPLAEVRGVIAAALASPPTEDEIERAVAGLDVTFVDMVAQSRIQATNQLADTIVNAVNIREAVASPETFLEVFRGMRDRITPQALLEHSRKLFTGQVVRGLYLTPEAGEATAGQLRAALLAPVAVDASAGQDLTPISIATLPPIGQAAGPVFRQALGTGLFSTTEQLEFANGVRAMIRDSDNEPGRVTVQVRFGRGRAAFSEAEAPYIDLGERALMASGMGELGQNELDRLGAGRKLGLGFSVGDGVFTFTGDTRAEDLADQLYLFAAKLAMPRWDVAPVERVKASMVLGYDALDGDPTSVLNRDLEALLHGNDPRFATPDPATIRGTTASGFREVWLRMLQQGPVEVSVFGDIDPEATITALSATFGALPPRHDAATGPQPEPFRAMETGGDRVVLTHAGDANQAAAVVAWPTGGGSAGLPLARKLDLLAQLVSNRLLERLREADGASYTPFAASDWPRDNDSGGYIMALVQMQTGAVDTFFTLVDQIVADLAANGPSADELARVVEPVRQNILRAEPSHGFWLGQLQGGTFDDERLRHLPTLGTDYLGTTPEEIRMLAQRFLADRQARRIVVLPRGGGVEAPSR
ncbi:M16 family metallopeptidase [Alteraurantiacibacter buctensis]|uniref:Insulinase family protein n=1 Tax=Alteraurantiacibacter buctensis TaxID=1503981 RepID=A0A844YZ36_9SPHN|nr:M16 family metallopeptidase [Alteraurantiacibacter buctensis]MXO71347.1 insulinase family protein [Alteraurantiacibacter buctensis]